MTCLATGHEFARLACHLEAYSSLETELMGSADVVVENSSGLSSDVVEFALAAEHCWIQYELIAMAA